MKKLLLLLLITINCFSQEKHPDTDFFINNRKIYWEHVFNFPNKDSISLIKAFKKEILLSIKIENLIESENVISFQISDDMPNFRKYGGTLMGTPFIAQMYMKYLVSVEFKNEKYRVTIKEILLTNKSNITEFLEYFVSSSSYKNFKNSGILSRGLSYDEKHFIEKFSINNEVKKQW